MTVISTIITDAYREANLIAVGASETTAQQTEGLRLLNRFTKSLFGMEFGEPLEDVNYGLNNVDPNSTHYGDQYLFIRNWFVPINRRLVVNTTEALEVNLHPKPYDGSRFAVSNPSNNFSTATLTVNGNGRTIEDATSLTINEDGLEREWFYRGDLGNWVRMTDLAIDSDSPFPEEFDDLLIVGLSTRLASRYGVPTAPESAEFYGKALKHFKARYSQKQQVQVEEGLLRNQENFYRFWSYSDPFEFDRGHI